MISDVADVATTLASGAKRRLPSFIQPGRNASLGKVDDVWSRYYLRLSLLDKPGVLARVADVLGKHQISIASMIQKEERRGTNVPVIVLTHAAQEKNCRSALAEIDALDVVGAKTVRLRIEDFGAGK